MESKFLDSIPRRIETDRMVISLLDESDSPDISEEIRGASWDDIHRWVAWADRKEKFLPEENLKPVRENISNFWNASAYFGVARLKDSLRLGPQVTLYGMNIEKKIGQFGYWTPTELKGQKLTQEAGVAIIELGHRHYGLEEIFANHSEGNEASRKILLNLGFEFTHKVSQGAKRGNGEQIDALHYVRNRTSRLPNFNLVFE